MNKKQNSYHKHVMDFLNNTLYTSFHTRMKARHVIDCDLGLKELQMVILEAADTIESQTLQKFLGRFVCPVVQCAVAIFDTLHHCIMIGKSLFQRQPRELKAVA